MHTTFLLDDDDVIEVRRLVDSAEIARALALWGIIERLGEPTSTPPEPTPPCP